MTIHYTNCTCQPVLPGLPTSRPNEDIWVVEIQKPHFEIEEFFKFPHLTSFKNAIDHILQQRNRNTNLLNTGGENVSTFMVQLFSINFVLGSMRMRKIFMSHFSNNFVPTKVELLPTFPQKYDKRN